jgi:hypothetical protein
MHHTVLQHRPAEIEEQIANGLRQVAQHRGVITDLESNGRPADHAKYLLAGS